jgi:hypothetical protein
MNDKKIVLVVGMGTSPAMMTEKLRQSGGCAIIDPTMTELP